MLRVHAKTCAYPEEWTMEGNQRLSPKPLDSPSRYRYIFKEISFNRYNADPKIISLANFKLLIWKCLVLVIKHRYRSVQ